MPMNWDQMYFTRLSENKKQYQYLYKNEICTLSD